MSKVTKEQIAAAKKIGTLDYLQRFEPDELVRTYVANGRTMHCKDGEYRTRTHDSLSIKGEKFYWWSRGIGGHSALDYLVKVKEMDFKDAVRFLAGEDAQCIPPAVHQRMEPEKKTLCLPERNPNNRRVFAYLSRSRGIDPEIINHAIKKGLIYEDKEHHNLVFVGYKGNEARFAAVRSTLTESKWRMDVKGSDKRYGFRMEMPESRSVTVFEAPIDAMSFAALLKMQGKDWRDMDYVALGGISPLAIVTYLSEHPATQTVTIALDNDPAGCAAAEAVRRAVLSECPGITVKIIRPAAIQGKDWNEVLLFKRGPREKPPPILNQKLSQAKEKLKNEQREPASPRHERPCI